MAFTPSQEILSQYANILIHFALGSGKGAKSGEVIAVYLPESAKPFYVPLRNTILKAGAIPLMFFLPQNVAEADFYRLANDHQLDTFLYSYYKGIVDQVDHMVFILAEADKYALAGTDPKKIMRAQQAMKPYREFRNAKEAAGKFTWTIALYGTEAMAKDVNLSLEEYWEQIIQACFLNSVDPVAKWQTIFVQLEEVRAALNKLHIKQVHLQAEETDLHITIGPNREWLGGDGRNIPSFELFTSPDWRGTEGHIYFNQPLFRYGDVIENIRLEFKNGQVVTATASKNQDLLRAMIEAENADKIGEFSLTDADMSPITHVMGETLFDENMGGKEGNTHIALGSAYQDTYPGDTTRISQEEWQQMGYNQSAIHTDIISTTPRKVTAETAEGESLTIYENGHFHVL